MWKPEFSVFGDRPRMRLGRLLLLRPTQKRPLKTLYVTLKLAVGDRRPSTQAVRYRMDSLEETLQELETTLSEMGAKSTMTMMMCPGIPQPLHPHPQVAAIPFFSLLPSCSRLWACRVEEWGRRSSAHLPHLTV